MNRAPAAMQLMGEQIAQVCDATATVYERIATSLSLTPFVAIPVAARMMSQDVIRPFYQEVLDRRAS